MSDAKKTLEINDRETAAVVAARVGITFPAVQGKPPKTALYNRLTELGFEITGTYLPKPKPKLPAVPAGKREYEITRKVAGKPDETVRVTIGELREVLHLEGVKGSLGNSRIRAAVTKLREAEKLFVGWEEQDIRNADIVPVATVVARKPDAKVLAILDAALAPEEPVKPVEEPSKPRTPRNSRAKATTAKKTAEKPVEAPAKA